MEKNSGHGIARRIGLENCTNEFIALMDSDDISVSDRFEKQLSYFEQNCELAIVGGNICEFVGTSDNCVGKRIVPESDSDIKAYMKKRCPMNQVTVMFRKEAVQDAGGYLDWYCNEDYYLWIRMSLNNQKFANIPEILVNVRVGKDMYARRGGGKYLKSEIGIQKFMLEKGLIDKQTYISNCVKRYILQKALPNSIRGWVFKKFARS